MKIWRDYDQAALDAQYGTRSQIGAGYDAWTARWLEQAELTRTRLAPWRDVAYGPGPRQTLDIFPAERTPAPVAVFFHGGFWRARDKSDYSFIADGLRGLGALPVLVNYPLCPAATLDEVIASARAAVLWLLDRAARYGGDPARLWLFGHSAGAHLAAMCCADSGDAASASLAGRVSAALMTSGIYELEPVRLCFANADIRLDEAMVTRLSPARLKPNTRGPLLLAVGGAETAEFDDQARDYITAMRAAGTAAQLHTVAEANHYTIVPPLATPGSALLTAFAAML